jgi:hypothetical protein
MISAKARFVRRNKALSSTPSQPDLKPSAGTAICSKCQAVWRKGTWSLDPAVRREVRRWRAPTSVLCPACRSQSQGTPTGILYLSGSFLARNRTEILNRLRSAERAATIKNPLERVIRIQDDSRSRVVVETTSEKLARRLGRAISKACGGTLEIRFSHEDRFVRVYWRRDAAGSAA